MQVIRIISKTDNKLDLITKAVKIYCILRNVKISDTQALLMAYFIVYGINKDTKDLIVRSQIVNHDNSVNNILNQLRKMGLLDKSTSSYKIIKDLQVNVEKSLGMIIKLENL